MIDVQHIVLRRDDGWAIAGTDPERRRLARSVSRIGRDFGLVAFRSGERLDLLAACDARRGGELARRIELSLGRGLRIPCGFMPAHVRPVEPCWNLESAFRYLWRRTLPGPPDPFGDASNLPDLLGMRVLGRYTLDAVRRLLPAVGHDELAGYFGGARFAAGAAAALDEELCLDDLADAAAGAFGLDRLAGATRAVAGARRAAVHAFRARAPTDSLAVKLGISTRAAQRMLREPPALDAVRAVRLQLRVRSHRRALAALDAEGKRRWFASG